MAQIKVGLIGVGNCASALVQGRFYYDDPQALIPGLITRDFGGYCASDISFRAAFDADERKVGLDLSQAIFAPPNCTKVFHRDVPFLDCPVQMGYVLDSFPSLDGDFDKGFKPLDNIYPGPEEARWAVVRALKERGVEVLVNYLPTGSEKNTLFYADCALQAGCAFINAIPVFASKTYGEKFARAGLPILGDDVKSQVGATILHRVLTRLFEDRGMPIKRTYQLNVGGNTDFYNMLDRKRLVSKKISKTQAVTSQLDGHRLDKNDIHVGPSDYVPWLDDNKVCFLRIEAEHFGGVPMELEVRLSVEDSPNSAGVIMDAIRAAKVALDRGLAGPIIEASAYLFKSPVVQYDDDRAREMLKEFARPPENAALPAAGQAV
ncbi:MAG: inositol-3-phosphate synthase [Thermodesulfobacteriota bacterium]